ncbi:MAG: hypothetical protein H0W87_01265 [Actinobacteria bacterium]|nr:hypothetical protein [Actinomycetota bacterium]
MLVAALGDSITAGSPGWDPDPRVRAAIHEPNAESQYEHWASRRDPGLEFRNCGIYGQRTDEIALRLEACAEGAEILIVQGGINDIAQRRQVESAAENLRAMVVRGRLLGRVVFLADVLPWNNGHPEAEGPIRRLNELIADIGVQVLPFHQTLEDSERPGRMREEWTSDGDHPSVEGYRLLGEVVAASIAARRDAT